MPTRKRRSVADAPKFKLRHFILCDEARQEVGGKLLLIGVYSDLVLIPTAEVVLPRLAFVFGYTRLTSEQPESATFRLDGPNGNVLPETTFAVKPGVPEYKSSNMMIQTGGVPLSVGGYRAVFIVNNSTEFVGEFEVRQDPTLPQVLPAGGAY